MRGGRLLRVLAATAVLLAGCDEVSFVERVVIVNDTVYAPRVEVRGREGGWLPLMTAPPGETREVRQVIDQGDTWIFRFTYTRYDPVEVELSKIELEESDWRVEVPEELELMLRSEGVLPPP